MTTADEERTRLIEELVGRVTSIDNSEHRECALLLMDAILELHGAGIQRMLEIVEQSGEGGQATLRRFITDHLVSSLLVLHDLHPDDPETRIREALRKVRGKAELTGIFEDTASVRLSEDGCGLKESVEALIREAAPDISHVRFDEAPGLNGFVPLAALAAPIPKVN